MLHYRLRSKRRVLHHNKKHGAKIVTPRRRLSCSLSYSSPGNAIIPYVTQKIKNADLPDTTSVTPDLSSETQACASRKYSTSPWLPIPKGHRYKTCKEFIHTWCIGLISNKSNKLEDYCICCSDGNSNPENNKFAIPQNPNKGGSESNNEDEIISHEFDLDNSINRRNSSKAIGAQQKASDCNIGLNFNSENDVNTFYEKELDSNSDSDEEGDTNIADNECDGDGINDTTNTGWKFITHQLQ